MRSERLVSQQDFYTRRLAEDGLSCAPALVPLCPGSAQSEWVLLCLFPAPVIKGGTELKTQHEDQGEKSLRSLDQSEK